MKKLIEVLQILVTYMDNSKYDDVASWRHVIYLTGPHPSTMSQEHADRLKELNARYNDVQECWEFNTKC